MGLVKAYNGDMPYIFISYSHKDTNIVLQMISQMQADGFRAWYDEGIKPGAEWDDYIASKVNKSSYFVAFLSDNYLASSNCKDEMNYARDHVDNILLVYLAPVNLPSGMEMRFGRSQAIHAYNYESKDEFFNKLYLSKDINLCRGDSQVNIVEESFENIPDEPYDAPVTQAAPVAPSTPAPKMAHSVEPEQRAEPKPKQESNPEPAEHTKLPEIKVERVSAPGTRASNKKLMWIIIAAAILVIAIVIGVSIALSNNSDKKSESDTTTTTENNIDEATKEDSKETSSASEEENQKPQGLCASYGLSVGEFHFSEKDTVFHDNSGTPLFYDYEKGDYTGGTFSGVFAMVIEIPVSNDYFDPLHIQWYYVDPDGNETLVADFDNISPLSDEGLKWFELNLSALDLGGEFQFGDYYAVAYTGNIEEPSFIAHVQYNSSN